MDRMLNTSKNNIKTINNILYKMYNTLCNTLYNGSVIINGAISGSVAWIVFRDLYVIHITNRGRYIHSGGLSEIFALNPGAIIGMGLGISYLYTGKPFINAIFD